MVLGQRKPSTVHVGAQPRSLSFSGCGFLGVYHIGVASCIKQHAPEFLKGLRRIYGCSAGSIVGAMLLNDVCCGEVCKSTLEIVRDMRSRYLGPLSPSFRINKILLDGFRKALPPDAHVRASGKLFISLTRVSDMKNVIVSEYATREELIDALLCSCFVPFYSGLFPPTYKGVYYVDGGLTNNLPTDPDTITISPWSGASDICPKNDSDISLLDVHLANTSAQMTIKNLHRLSTMFFPPEGDALSNFCKQGFREALQYLQDHGLFETTNPTKRSMSFSSELEDAYRRKRRPDRMSMSEKWVNMQESAKFQIGEVEWEELDEESLELAKGDYDLLEIGDSGVSETSSVITDSSGLQMEANDECDSPYDANHNQECDPDGEQEYKELCVAPDPMYRLMRSETVVRLCAIEDRASLLRFGLPAVVIEALEASYLNRNPRWYNPVVKIASLCGSPLILAKIPLHVSYSFALFILKHASSVPASLKWVISSIYAIVCAIQKRFQTKGSDLVSKLQDAKDELSDDIKLLSLELCILVHIALQKMIENPGEVAWLAKMKAYSPSFTRLCKFVTF